MGRTSLCIYLETHADSTETANQFRKQALALPTPESFRMVDFNSIIQAFYPGEEVT